MLKLFEVTGFKNFHEKITLDFSDVRDYRFNEHCVKDGLLKNIIIYGKNASGKSNLSLALYDIAIHLADKEYSNNRYENYLNTTYVGGEAEFRYMFQFGESIVEYIYRKSTVKKLTYEKLMFNGKVLLVRDYTNAMEDDLSGIQELAPTLNFSFHKEGSIVKYAITNAAIPKEHHLNSMMHFVSSMRWSKALDKDRVDSTDFDVIHDLFASDINKLNNFRNMLTLAGLKDSLHVVQDPDGVKRLYSSPEYHPSGRLPFFQTASNGTYSLFALYVSFFLYARAKAPPLVIIDEFDAFYHFELAETIVKLLSEQPNTQVVLTSHNTNLLTNKIMRPDCYFILTPEKLTSFANATSRELREGHNLEKLYMSGEFSG